jgi:hypothetical protein
VDSKYRLCLCSVDYHLNENFILSTEKPRFFLCKADSGNNGFKWL